MPKKEPQMDLFASKRLREVPVRPRSFNLGDLRTELGYLNEIRSPSVRCIRDGESAKRGGCVTDRRM